MRFAPIVAGAILFACGGAKNSAPDSGLGDASYMAQTVCQQLAQAECDLLTRCFPAFDRLSSSDCQGLQESVCEQELAPVVDSVNAGRVIPDNSAVAGCVSRMAQAPCPPALPPTAPPVAVRAFEECDPTKLYVGTVAQGQVCKSPADCVAGVYCNQPTGVCEGVCVPYSEPGDLCSGGCDPATAYCDETKNPPYCEAFEGANASCQSSSDCQSQLACIGGMCTPPPGMGQPCTFLSDRVPYCAAGLACDVAPFVNASGTCVVPGAEGAPCHYHWSCAQPLVCRGMNWSGFPVSAPTAGTCGAPATLGEGCAYTSYAIYVGDECATGLSCDATTSKCIQPPGAGDSCDPTIQNCVGANTWCVGPTGHTTCGPPPSIGNQCAWILGACDVVQVPCSTGWCDVNSNQQCATASAQVGDSCTQDAQCVSGRCETNANLTQTCWAKCSN
jgi:hypothetical protein